jgi:23S rRNA (cytosine1962-C5)-methyltransferase
MYRVLKIKKGRERSLRNRHPWVFSGAAVHIPDYRNGEIVEVVSVSGEILGYGFFSPGSQILCRMFEFGALKSENFSKEYFHEKIVRAAAVRKRIISDNTDCYRLINSEGDFFPGLIADVYAGVVVLQILIKGAELLIDIIADSLESLGYKNICIKSPGANEVERVDIPFSFIRGSSEASVIVKENGLNFIVDPEHGQKTGFFVDQRDNRELVRNLSRGKRVLNAFCYTGGFSVYALSGGAGLVHSVDISADAVEMTLENIKINSGDKGDLQSGNHKAVKADCFDYLRTMEDDLYDLIILDPPAFVKSSRGVERGARGYKDINLSAMKKIKKDSLLFTFSCSHHVDADLFRKIVFSAAADSGRDVRVLAQLSQSMDHPFSIYHPEGEYLKGLMLHVD